MQRRPDLGGVAAWASGLYLVALGLSALAYLTFGGLAHALVHDTLAFVTLTCLASIGSIKRIYRIAPNLTLSIVSIVLVAAAALLGPGGAALVALISSALPVPGGDQEWRVRLFNLFMAGNLGGAAGGVYLLAGGLHHADPGLAPHEVLTRVALPMLAADIAMAVLNALLIGIMAGLEQRQAPFRFARQLLRGGGLAYLGYGVIGFMLAALWGPVGLGAGAVGLVLVPVVVAQWASQQVANEAISHERTVAALVAAAEAENIFVSGHSARVASLAGLIAVTAGRDDQERKTLRLAALLHDIGTMAVPAQTWRADPPFTAADVEAYLDHPRRGVEIVTGIAFLEPCLSIIEHHHERWDGQGYPAGLAGESIPWSARAIAVADAFDSLTSTRSYRPALTTDEAMRELRLIAGTHLDPELVEILACGLERSPWPGTGLDPFEVEGFGAAKDHDDPRLTEPFLCRRQPHG